MKEALGAFLLLAASSIAFKSILAGVLFTTIVVYTAHRCNCAPRSTNRKT